MSCHFSPKYSLGRIPVVSATASTGPFSWQSSFYKCLRLLYAQRTHFAPGPLRDFDTIGRILKEQTSLQCLPHGRP